MIKQEFTKHGWKIRNESELKSEDVVYYVAVKDNVRFEVIERDDFRIWVSYKKDYISMPMEEATWGNVVQGMKKSLDERIRCEDAKMEKALSASKERKERYEKAKRTIGC